MIDSMEYLILNADIATVWKLWVTFFVKLILVRVSGNFKPIEQTRTPLLDKKVIIFRKDR